MGFTGTVESLEESSQSHLIAGLFNAYRVFYGQKSDPLVSEAFIRERLQRGDSKIFLARNPMGDSVGFTQLYPLYTSVKAGKIWLLNDLFVASEFRREGVAKALLEKARDFGRLDGAVSLLLETAKENHPARSLYEATGWIRSRSCYHHYSLEN